MTTATQSMSQFIEPTSFNAKLYNFLLKNPDEAVKIGFSPEDIARANFKKKQQQAEDMINRVRDAQEALKPTATVVDLSDSDDDDDDFEMRATDDSDSDEDTIDEIAAAIEADAQKSPAKKSPAKKSTAAKKPPANKSPAKKPPANKSPEKPPANKKRKRTDTDCCIIEKHAWNTGFTEIGGEGTQMIKYKEYGQLEGLGWQFLIQIRKDTFTHQSSATIELFDGREWKILDEIFPSNMVTEHPGVVNVKLTAAHFKQDRDTLEQRARIILLD